MAFVKEIVVACEKCGNAVECRVMNRDRCGSSYTPALNTNFDMTKEYPNPDPQSVLVELP